MMTNLNPEDGGSMASETLVSNLTYTHGAKTQKVATYILRHENLDLCSLNLTSTFFP